MSSDPTFALHGEVYYLPRIALPGTGCTLTVTLSDITRTDVAARVIAQSTTAVTHQVPLQFLLKYLPSDVPQDSVTTALSARIEHNGRTIWVNDSLHEITLGEFDQTNLRIRVVQVNG